MGQSYTTVCRNITWRLRDLDKIPFYRSDIIKAIMKEAGMDKRTIDKYLWALRELGFVKCLGGKVYKFGDEI